MATKSTIFYFELPLSRNITGTVVTKLIDIFYEEL